MVMVEGEAGDKPTIIGGEEVTMVNAYRTPPPIRKPFPRHALTLDSVTHVSSRKIDAWERNLT
jgi:hypothetical protein